MAILQINKIDIADPMTLTWDLYDLDSEDGAGRNQEGLMFRDRVAVKRKLNCTWPPMEPFQMAALLQAMDAVFFTMRYPEPFNIEEDIYTHWAGVIKEKIQPDLMICGHLHKTGVHPVGGKLDAFGQPCTMVVGSRPDGDYYKGVGYIFRKDSTDVIFTDSDGKREETVTV